MDLSSSWYVVASVIVGFVLFFGVAVLFVRAENIERNWMVGGLTILTSAIAGYILLTVPRGLTNASLFGVVLMSVFGFALGRFLDLYLGPRDDDTSDPGRHSFGSDYAD